MALLDFQMDNTVDELEIITGNGRVLKDVVIEILEEERLDYETPQGNLGCVIVYKE